jgi:hypothetical protein
MEFRRGVGRPSAGFPRRITHGWFVVAAIALMAGTDGAGVAGIVRSPCLAFPGCNALLRLFRSKAPGLGALGRLWAQAAGGARPWRGLPTGA